MDTKLEEKLNETTKFLTSYVHPIDFAQLESFGYKWEKILFVLDDFFMLGIQDNGCYELGSLLSARLNYKPG